MDEGTCSGFTQEINQWKTSSDTETTSWDNTHRELVWFGAAIKSEVLEAASVAEDAVDRYVNVGSREVPVASCGFDSVLRNQWRILC